MKMYPIKQPRRGSFYKKQNNSQISCHLPSQPQRGFKSDILSPNQSQRDGINQGWHVSAINVNVTYKSQWDDIKKGSTLVLSIPNHNPRHIIRFKKRRTSCAIKT